MIAIQGRGNSTRTKQEDTMSLLRGTACLFTAFVLVALGAPAQAQTKVRIGKPQAGAFQFVPVDVGIEVGIFKKRGLDVESSDFGGGPRVQQALTAGALDFAIGSGPELAMITKGAPEIGVAAIADAPYAVVLAVLNDGPKTIADLKGKTVSVSNKGGLTYWLAQELSRRQGWGTEGFNIAPLGATSAQTAALKTKQIDGMIVEVNAGYRLEEDKSGRVLVQFGDLIKTFHIYVLYAHTDFAEKNPEAVRAFVAGWFETIDWMQKNRDKTIEIVRRKTDVSQALATRDYNELRGMFNPTGKFNPEALKVLSRSFVEIGTLPSEPDVSKLITEKFLPGAK
jgi:ABC-type nitrate/sulfonate/bicarbonate transport system substrate-binding protein